jgi:hypothetical protein
MDDESNHREIVSVRDYFERRLEDLDRRFVQQHEATQRALDKAEQALGRRLDGMNEFRDALKDQSNRMATQEQLDRVRDRVIEQEKRAAVVAAVWSIIVSVIVGVLVRWLVK